MGTVVVTAGFNAAVLILGGIEDWRIVAATMFVAYLVLAVVEGLILALTTGFLVQVKPEPPGAPDRRAARTFGMTRARQSMPILSNYCGF